MSLPRQTVRWFGKSLAGLVLNLALLTVWVDGLGLEAWWAVGINWILLAAMGYVLADQWVFQNFSSPGSLRSHARQFVSMQGVMGAGKVLNYIVYVLLLQLVDYRLAWVAGAGVSFSITLAGNRYLWDSVG